jgi:hypothetical protein
MCDWLLAGLISRAPATIPSTITARTMASHVPVCHNGTGPGQPIGVSASAKVATRDEVWRRRRRLRLACVRNQYWIGVAEAAPMITLTSAAKGAATPSMTTKGLQSPLITKGQQPIRELVRAMRDNAGNMPRRMSSFR